MKPHLVERRAEHIALRRRQPSVSELGEINPPGVGDMVEAREKAWR